MKDELLNLARHSHQHAIALWQITDRLEALEASLFTKHPDVREDVAERLKELRRASSLALQESHRQHEALQEAISRIQE